MIQGRLSNDKYPSQVLSVPRSMLAKSSLLRSTDALIRRLRLLSVVSPLVRERLEAGRAADERSCEFSVVFWFVCFFHPQRSLRCLQEHLWSRLEQVPEGRVAGSVFAHLVSKNHCDAVLHSNHSSTFLTFFGFCFFGGQMTFRSIAAMSAVMLVGFL